MDDTAALDTTDDRLPRDDATDAAPATPATPPTTSPADELVDEMLIEEISIDGMCGVY